MDTLQYILNTSPYFPVLVTLVLGLIVGKLTIGRFCLGSTLGILTIAVIVGQVGVKVDPDLMWLFFGVFMYVVGYQGYYQLVGVIKDHKKSIIIASILMSFVPLIVVAVASQLFDINIYKAIGIAAGSFIHPEIIPVATETIQQLVGLSNQTKEIAINELYIGYALTVILGIAGTVIILKWLFPIMVKRSNTDNYINLQRDLFFSEPNKGNCVNTVGNVVRRSFQVNVHSTVIGKTIKQLNAPSVDVTFELESNDKDEFSLITTGDIITITGRSNTLYYFDDNILGNELPLDDNQCAIEEHTMIMVSSTPFVGSKLQSVKCKINENTFREVCVTQVIRAREEMVLTPELVLKKNDVIQLIGHGVDIKLAGSYFKTSAEDVWHHQLLFGFGLVIAYLISLCHISLGSLNLYFSLGITSLISGVVIGYSCNKNIPLALMPKEISNHIRRLSLGGFIAISGLYFGPITINAISDVGVNVFFIGCGIVALSQLVYFAICYSLFMRSSSAASASYARKTPGAGSGFSDPYSQYLNRSVMLSFSISYVSSSMLMLILVSSALNLISR